MASTLVNFGKKDSIPDVPIKAVEIQAATHLEIIAVGNDVFQKNNDKQMEQFNAKLQHHELNLIKRLEEEKKTALDDLRVEHELNIEKLRQQYTVIMDNALKEEAGRLQDIMDKIATSSLEEEKLEGQRMLDASLVKARADFDVEKAEAIMQVTLEHEERQKEIERQNKVAHNARIEKLIMEWEGKMKIQAEKNLLHENETLENERKQSKRRFDIRLEETLSEADRRHTEKVNKLNQNIEDEKLHGDDLKNNILSLNTSIDTMKADMKNVLVSFQSFIDQSPGFSPGQSEFVLDNLIPGGFDEFISSSN